MSMGFLCLIERSDTSADGDAKQMYGRWAPVASDEAPMLIDPRVDHFNLFCLLQHLVISEQKIAV